jgi:hypothetical protein
MKRLRWIQLAAFLLASTFGAANAWGQAVTQPAGAIKSASSAPSGPCPRRGNVLLWGSTVYVCPESGAQNWTAVGSGGGSVSGSGTTNRAAFWTGSGAIGTPVTLDFDSGSNELQLTEAVNANGPQFGFYWNKATPSANDRVGEWHWYSNNSAGTKTQLAAIYAEIQDTTAGSEDTKLMLNLTRGGAVTEMLHLSSLANEFIFNPVGSTMALNYRSGGATKVYIDNTEGVQVRSAMGTGTLGYNNIRLGLNGALPSLQFDHNSASTRWMLDTGGTSNAFRWVVNAATVSLQLATNGTIIQAGVTFANLGTPANGSLVYCSDCGVTSGADNTCATGFNGALAVRLAGAWKCLANQN